MARAVLLPHPQMTNRRQPGPTWPEPGRSSRVGERRSPTLDRVLDKGRDSRSLRP